jgi:hypothetical protein
MKATLAFAVILAMTGTAGAETPQDNCVTIADTTVTTLPMASEQQWHQAPIQSRKLRQAAAVWTTFPAGTEVGIFATTYIDQNNVEWDWVSGLPEGDDTTITGWVRRSQLRCR